MRLLVGPRPEVDVLHLVVAAAERERPGLGPGAHDQVVRFVEAVVREGRVDAEGVVLGADAAHEAADQAPAADHVDHRVLLGDRHGMRTEGQRAAENGDLYFGSTPGKSRCRHDRRRHQAVRGLVVLVDRDHVEAELLAVLQLVEEAVVELVPLLRVEVLVRQLDPHRAVLASGLEIEVGVRHQVEEDYLHTIETNSSGFSTGGRWPQFLMMWICAFGSRRENSFVKATGTILSFSPQTIFTGTSMRCSHFGRCGSWKRGSQARRAVVWRFLSCMSIACGVGGTASSASAITAS